MRLISNFLCAALIQAVFLAFGQPKQENSAELERRHGFKHIKLESSIDSIQNAVLKKEFMERDEFPAKLYSVKDQEVKSIGEVKVHSVTLKTYKDLIYEIEVNTEKDGRLMKGLEKALGKAAYNLRTSAYHWRAESLSLTFIGNKNSLTLIYKSYEIYKMMLADRGQKVDDIADDF